MALKNNNIVGPDFTQKPDLRGGLHMLILCNMETKKKVMKWRVILDSLISESYPNHIHFS